MRDAFISFRCFAARFKFISAVVGIFLAGSLLAIGSCAWYYGRVIDRVNAVNDIRVAAYDRQVQRLQEDIDIEREINREKLDQIIGRLERTSLKLGRTATTAKKAADTAQAAANNAAKANITVTAVEPTQDRWIEP